MSFTIKCPHCQRKLRVNAPAFGKTVPCPGCKKPVQISAPPSETSTPKPKSACKGHAGEKPDSRPKNSASEQQKEPSSGKSGLPRSNHPAAWYIPGQDGQSVGPYSAERIIQSLQAGRVNPEILCWREGLGQWLPLGEVQPFASALGKPSQRPRSERGSPDPPEKVQPSASAFRRPRVRTLQSWAVYSLIGALISLWAGLGMFAVYAYRSEAAILAKARNFVEEGRYHEAGDVLAACLKSTRFHRNETEYLLASARLRQYAASQSEPPFGALDQAGERFRRLLLARPRWRERARYDLAALMDSIPAGAPDALDRSATVGGILEDLGLPGLAAPPEWLEREKQFAALHGKAIEAVGKGDLPAAVAWLNKALNIKPDDDDTRRRLADATSEIVRQKLAKAEPMVAEGKYTGARMLMAQVEKLDAGNFEAEQLLGRIERLIQLAALEKKVVAAIRSRDYEAALSLLREAVEIARDDEIAISRLLESQVNVAQRLVSEQSYVEAQMVLTEVLRREPGNTAAAELLGKLDDQLLFAESKQAGVAALEQGQYQRALELLSKASEANRRDEEVETLARKARMMLLQGSPVLARGGVAEYTRENPEVWEMVKRASDYLLKRDSPSHGAGGEALIALALYKAGIETSNAKVQAGIKAARTWASSSADTLGGTHTYTPALCFLLLAEADPLESRPQLELLLNSILARQRPSGSWTYRPPRYDDTSQTQYGLLCLWAAHQMGMEIAVEAIEQAALWHVRTQHSDGGWSYRPPLNLDPTPVADSRFIQVTHSMTAAGAGSLYVCYHLLGFAPQGQETVGDRSSALTMKRIEQTARGRTLRAHKLTPKLMAPAMTAADGWFSRNSNYDTKWWTHYYMCGLERYKSFRELVERNPESEPAWYKQGVEFLRKTQRKDGSWQSAEAPTSSAAIDTAFAILFLTRSNRSMIQRIGHFDRRARPAQESDERPASG